MAKYQKKTDNEKMGRPKIVIEKDQFEKLCGLCCTKAEVAYYFKCSEDTIENWVRDNYDGSTFSALFKVFSSAGKISLRRTQFRLAEKSAAMAIFLGKQYLGQKDVVAQEFKDISTIEKVAQEIFEGD